MTDTWLYLWIGLLTALPFIAAYWIGRFVSRLKRGKLLRTVRPWQVPTLQHWAERGWLDPTKVEALPGEVPPALVFYEWGSLDAETARHWRLREPLRLETPVEAMVADVWSNLPESVRAGARSRLAEAVSTHAEWWGGVERGWNGRALALLAGDVGKKQVSLPLLPMPDLTAAPAPGPIRGKDMAAEAEGPDLVLALFAVRRAQGLFTHPLAPKQGGVGSMLQGLSTQVASDVGRRVGAGIGAVLGPIGSMIGQHLGGLAGSLAGKSVADRMLPEPVQNALKDTETALARLGKLAETEQFARAAGRPAEAVLETGKRLEVVRQDRSRGLVERVWPTPGLVLVEEVLRVTASELAAQRGAGEHFVATARRSQEAVAGGMILQNPWMVAGLPEGPERLNAARGALNRAALVIRRAQDV
jgi:hypothetical protein